MKLFSTNEGTAVRRAKPANFATLMDDIGDGCAKILRGCGRAIRGMAGLPWPALLAAAILLALVVTIIPLALFLFVVFMLVKFAVTALASRKHPRLGD